MVAKLKEYSKPGQHQRAELSQRKKPQSLVEIRHCIYHNSTCRDITEFKSFNKLTVREREDWIYEGRLCFRCLSPHPQGNWEMPLSFHSQNVFMPNDRSYATKHLNSLLRTLQCKPQMNKDYLDFMAKILEKGHAVPVPPEEVLSQERSGNVWYLPHFGVYHPKKPDQIQVVFDSSAENQGESLNRQLLTGPDFMNSFVGVLSRVLFRREDIAAMCHIKQMFHSFQVDPKHRNFLFFSWLKDNDPSQYIIEYRMTVHLFGNGPSPAVDTYGLRRTVEVGEELDPVVKEFV